MRRWENCRKRVCSSIGPFKNVKRPILPGDWKEGRYHTNPCVIISELLQVISSDFVNLIKFSTHSLKYKKSGIMEHAVDFLQPYE